MGEVWRLLHQGDAVADLEVIDSEAQSTSSELPPT